MLTSRARTFASSIDSRSEQIVCDLLRDTDIRLDGSRPSDIVVHNKRFFTRLLRDGALGFGESYMDGMWDCEALDELVGKLVRARLDKKVRANWSRVVHVMRARALNLQSTLRAFQIGERHYDLGNDLYQAMLDRETMAYTCAYWRDADTLEAAQRAKLDLVCRKLGLRPGMRVLELGCGWGSFARYAAAEYGVSVTGFTVSRDQVDLGSKRCAGLPVELRLDDYRNARGMYDAVVSIGLLEHVGYKNYRTYMEVVDRCLKPDGTALIHCIGGNESTKTVNEWFHRYIFPNALLPSLSQLAAAAEGLFVIEDVHNFGPDYDRTLIEWWRRFDAAWPELRDAYGDRFYRMWRFYLYTCAGAFRARYQQLFQLVLTRIGTAQPPCRVV
jgi:cyclopropane-fatty-acyl-phospholipid synthase